MQCTREHQTEEKASGGAHELRNRLGLKMCMMCPGTSYAEFIRMAHLPAQLADVDPIVASFCGGAVGVLSTLMLVEVNNSKTQAASRCIYCGVSMCLWLCQLQERINAAMEQQITSSYQVTYACQSCSASL